MKTNNMSNVIYVSNQLKGKMQGVPAISTSILHSKFCQKMQGVDGTVCSECYGRNTERIYPGARAQYFNNYLALSKSIIDVDLLPRFNNNFVRFNAHGELINLNHIINIFNICTASGNERVTFSLWTKRPKLVQQAINKGYKKPSNLIIILSGFYTNKTTEKPVKYDFIDKVFNVYTAEYATEHNITINCGARSCMSCQRCYNLDNKEIYVNEILK